MAIDCRAVVCRFKIALMSERTGKAYTAAFGLLSDEFIAWSSISVVVTATLLWLAGHDAVWWSSSYPAIWSSEVWSRSNSQHPLDPYTLTHTMFGILCFWTFSLIAKGSPLSRRFLFAIIAACVWELCENSMLFIERFRHATAAADYMGDALVNSATDIAACGVGFMFAVKIKTRTSVLIFIAVELLTAIWVRDNLLLNVLMIVCPIEGVKNWQIGI